MQNKFKFLKKNIENPSILVIRLSSIGDIVLASPILRILRNTFSNANIDFLTLDRFSEINLFNPRISKIFSVNKSKLKFNKIEFIYEGKIVDIGQYDFIVDLQNNKYSHKIIKKIATSKTQVYSYPKNRLHKLSLVYLKKPLINDFHVVKEYLKALERLQLNDDGLGLEFWLKGEIQYLPFTKNTTSNTKKKIAIAPGAAHKTKQWIAENFVELIDQLLIKYDSEIVLLGGKNEQYLCQIIEKQINGEIINLSGQKTIIETAKIIDEADVLITNDTGLMHIAAARQTPIVAIFGSSVRELGFYPFRCKFIIVEKDIWCRPCSHIGRDFCPLIHFDCMKKITVKDVLNAVGKMLPFYQELKKDNYSLNH